MLRTPTECLLRFKGVCKDWCSLIKDPKFVKKHFDHHKANDQSIGIVFIYANCIQQYYLYLTIFNKLWEYKDVPSYKIMENDKFRVKVPTDGISKLTSCNGLLCFHTEFPLLMVNPITREILELPKPWIEEEDEEASACGFGLDAKMNVYKVVQLELCFSNSSLECEVLELGTTISWRKIQHQPSFPCPDLGDPDEHLEPVFVEGSIYWLASENILCFDVAAKRLKLIPEPDHQKAQCCGNYNTFLVELDKSLCLMTHGISSGMVGIWKMQKDSVNEETT
ncbi:putative F-box protein At1g47790 [Papaver somniferum]|uniref:putative F-box protein At1g47790 n=1 Tax=Papaver somniferum TaxID=3469 RepID=UPI000E6FA1FE|nr:putative F-box protein At1g47790 [Papaver somniferum]